MWESHAAVWRVRAATSTPDFQMVCGEGRERGYDIVSDRFRMVAHSCPLDSSLHVSHV